MNFKPELALILLLSFWMIGWFIQKQLLSSLVIASPNAGVLNGVRGFLGYSVFLSHFLVWKIYVTKGIWTTDTWFLSHISGTSVALFFMLSAFLFIRKALKPNIDFFTLYIGRILRVIPLWCLLIVISAMLLVASGVVMPRKSIVYDISYHSIIIDYHSITSGVTWTLWYEWLLYLSLPIISFIGLKKPTAIWVLASIVAVNIMVFAHEFRYQILFYFLLGGIVCFLPDMNRNVSHNHKSIALIVVIVLLYASNPQVLSVQYLLTGGLFYMLSRGWDIWGIRNTKTSNWLGDIGYSIYLMQGPYIYCVIRAIGLKEYAQFSELQLFFLILISTPFYICLCSFTHVFIEKMFWNKKNIDQLRRLVLRRMN